MSMFEAPRGRGGGGGGGRGGDRGRGDRGRGDRGRGDRGRGGDFRGSSRGRGGGRGGYQSQPAEVFNNENFPPPNTMVTDVENSFMSQKSMLSGSMAGMSVTEDFPERPAYGTKGKPVVLWANYFELTTSKNLSVYRYHLSVVPEAKGRKLKRIIELLLLDSRLKGCATDFKSILIGRKILPDTVVDIAYRSELEDDPQPNTKPYRVEIKRTGQIEVGALMDHLKSIQPDLNFRPEKKLQIIQVLNVLLGHYPQSNSSTATISGNKHYFYGANPTGQGPRAEHVDLGGGLSALRGYFRSVRQGTARMLVNINVSHAVFFRPGPLVELIEIFKNTYGQNLFLLEKFLKKVRVETTHLPAKKNKAGQTIPRIKTIIALASQNDGTSLPHPPKVAKFGASPRDVKFWLDLGDKKKPAREVTVAEFFEKQHGLKVKNSPHPVVNTGTRANPMYLPAECCMVLPGQASMKKLNPDQTAKMIGFACRRPHMNANSITSDGPGVTGLDPASGSGLASFGIKVNTNMITVPGRVLMPPTIKYRGTTSVNSRGGSWNMQGVKFTTGATVPPWTYLWIKRDRSIGHVEKFDQLQSILSEFQKMMNASGLIAPPVITGRIITLDQKSAKMSNDELIDSTLKAASASQQIGLMFVILPDSDAAVYNTVKYAGDIKYGMHTICVLDKKVAKQERRDQYLANVALKVNSKLLGVNQSLDTAKLGIIAEGKTMVVGIDVTHPSPGSLSSAPSVAAVVASTDKYLSQFPCELSIQESRKEMVTDLSSMFQSRLNLWRTRNKTLPENILIYRDGVSEGQYQVLKDTEIPALRAACNSAYPPDQKKKGLPKISVIVVGKRHHTRFYATKQSEADRSGNPNNGTVVDRGVTSMWNWDFFLQAHTCLQGTAKPAHYYVVLDEIFGKGNLKKPHPYPNAADTLEDLTHNMCYLFCRATKAVSICPPAYYADLACERARCYLSGHFDPSQSGGSSVTGGTQTTASAADVTIHNKLKNSMFYI